MGRVRSNLVLPVGAALVALVALAFPRIDSALANEVAPYGGSATVDLVHVTAVKNETGTIANVSVAPSRAEVGSNGLTAPNSAARSHAKATNLTADRPPFPDALTVAEQLAPPDHTAPTVVEAVKAPFAPLLDATLSRSTAQARWGDECAAAGTPIAMAKSELADARVLPGPAPGTAAVALHNGKGDTAFSQSTVGLRAVAGLPAYAVRSEVVSQISSLTLFEGSVNEVTVNVSGAPTITAIATGVAGGARVTYTQPILEVVQGGEPKGQLDASTNQRTIEVPSGVLKLQLGTFVKSQATDGTSASGSATLLSVQLVDRSPIPVDLIAPFTIAGGAVSALAPVGGVACPDRGGRSSGYLPGRWRTAPALQGEGFAGSVIGSKVYVSHGYRPGASAALSIFDVNTGLWSTGPSAVTPRSELVGAAVGGKHYAIGGRTRLQAVEIFNPGTSTWSLGAPMPTGRRAMGAAVIGTKIFVVGGSDGYSPHDGNPLETVEVYDTTSNTWSTGPPLPVPMMDVYATIARDSKIYVFGGYDGISVRSLVQILDVGRNTWSFAPDMPTPRSNAVAGVCGPNVVVIGGLNAATQNLGVTEAFDTTTNRWTTAAVKPTPGSEFAAGSVTATDGIHAIGSGAYGASGDVHEVFTCTKANAVADFNGDGRTDKSIYRPSTGEWWVLGGAPQTTTFGVSTDIPVPADFDGNGTTDKAVFRPSTGEWYVLGQPTVTFGVSTDIPVPADFDGNGTTDKAVFRPSTGEWYVLGQPTVTFGVSTDIPVPADFDGNGTTDKAVFRPSTGTWYVLGQGSFVFGANGDIPVPADYDGNGTTDKAVFRPSDGTWYVLGQGSTLYGANGDTPAPGDYDGNGTAERAVYRPSTGEWFVLGGSPPATTYGATGDIPLVLPNAIRRFFP